MIRIEGLRIRLAERVVLKEVNLAADRGETVALMGASGSGKSVLLRAAAGLIQPEAGEVWLMDQPVFRSSAVRLQELRRHVGLVFQGNALFDSMTVAENIGFFLREVLELSEQEILGRVEELLARLHLGPIGRMYPAQLSGGMKKRVSIARAVAHDPSIVFCDDPTAGLDPVTSEVIGDLLLELRQKKERAAILVSNYLPLVMKVATRAALLHEGRVIDLGPVLELLRHELPLLREFLGNGPGRSGAEGSAEKFFHD